jgi:aryl-alcohol dehydrogenase-like predicted oxidoreductase
MPEAGKIKAVGVSNYSAEQMRVAHAALAKRYSARLESGSIFIVAPQARSGRRPDTADLGAR